MIIIKNKGVVIKRISIKTGRTVKVYYTVETSGHVDTTATLENALTIFHQTAA